jgi:hypothetical protein
MINAHGVINQACYKLVGILSGYIITKLNLSGKQRNFTTYNYLTHLLKSDNKIVTETFSGKMGHSEDGKLIAPGTKQYF